jgi:hypothetical protein
VRRDVALPGLAVLLDPEAMRTIFTAQGGSVESVVPRYARYKPGVGCLVRYDVRLGGGGGITSAYARTRGVRDSAKLEKVHRRLLRRDGRGILCHDPPLLVTFFPTDAALPSLPRLADPSRRAGLLKRLLPGRPELWGADLQTLAYKPERRYVGKVSAAGAVPAVVRLYAPAEFERVRRSSRKLQAVELAGLTAPLRRSSRYQAVAVEWLDGRPLFEALRAGGETAATALRRVGRALARFHGSGVVLPRPGRGADSEAARAAGDCRAPRASGRPARPVARGGARAVARGFPSGTSPPR